MGNDADFKADLKYNALKQKKNCHYQFHNQTLSSTLFVHTHRVARLAIDFKPIFTFKLAIFLLQHANKAHYYFYLFSLLNGWHTFELSNSFVRFGCVFFLIVFDGFM